MTETRDRAVPGAGGHEESIDVERLARAMHEGLLHNGRGGVDDSLAKRACVQFGWENSDCLRRATYLAVAYRAEGSARSAVPPPPTPSKP